jgi:hypothetical protein
VSHRGHFRPGLGSPIRHPGALPWNAAGSPSSFRLPAVQQVSTPRLLKTDALGPDNWFIRVLRPPLVAARVGVETGVGAGTHVFPFSALPLWAPLPLPEDPYAGLYDFDP